MNIYYHIPVGSDWISARRPAHQPSHAFRAFRFQGVQTPSISGDDYLSLIHNGEVPVQGRFGPQKPDIPTESQILPYIELVPDNAVRDPTGLVGIQIIHPGDTLQKEFSSRYPG